MKSFWKAPVVRTSFFRIRSGSLIFFFLLGALTHAFSADNPILERTITIVLHQERTEDALKKIAAQGEFVFSYNPSILDVDKIVSFSFHDQSVREILDKMFDGTIDYKQRKNYIILTKSKSVSENSRVVSGYVTDETTGERLKNVTVYDPATLASTITDDYGFFKLKISNPDTIIRINRLNYTDTVVIVPDRLGLLRIQIKNRTGRIGTLADSLRKKITQLWKIKVLRQQDIINIENVNDTLYRKTQVSWFPFVGTNHMLSGNVINDYSFNIFGGYSLGVRKFELGGFFNIERGDASGLQMAGYFNGVGGKRKGVQLSGVVNATYDSSSGVQLAGSCNINWKATSGFSAAGLLNLTRGNSNSTSLAGLWNLTLGDQQGAHVAGLLNLTTKNARPFQMAGLANLAFGDMRGVQLGGLLNVTGKQMKGTQISGIINYATRIKGIQIGLINISDSIQGMPIGFLSFSLKGYHKIEVFADEIFYTNLAFKTGVRKFYNIFTAGIKPQQSDRNFWSVGYGFGTAPKITKWLSLNIDITANQLSYGNFTKAINMVNKLYVGVEAHAFPKASVFLGVTLNGYVTDTTYNNYTDVFTDYRPKILYDKTYGNDINMKMWWGVRAGVRFL